MNKYHFKYLYLISINISSTIDDYLILNVIFANIKYGYLKNIYHLLIKIPFFIIIIIKINNKMINIHNLIFILLLFNPL